MKDCLNGVISRAAEFTAQGETYLKDGLRYCQSCHTPRECEVTLFDQKRRVPVLCHCLAAKDREEQREAAEQLRLLRIDELRRQCFTEPALRLCRFKDAQPSALLAYAQRYAERFETILPENIGLMFTGEVGSGKTFAAACLANALIDRAVSVRLLSVPRLLAELQGQRDKGALLTDISHCGLLILDDLGSERGTDYVLEQLFLVVDTRCRCGKPLVVTTNLTLDELKNPTDLRYERIYDRIVGLCVPVRAPGGSRRAEQQRQMRARAIALLGEEGVSCCAPE